MAKRAPAEDTGLGRGEPKRGAACFFDGQDVPGLDGETTCRMGSFDDELCHGCGKIVCSNHAINVLLMGKHEPEDHLAWPEEDEVDAFARDED